MKKKIIDNILIINIFNIEEKVTDKKVIDKIFIISIFDIKKKKKTE